MLFYIFFTIFCFFYINYTNAYNVCKNNGVLINATNEDGGCYCGGLGHYGKYCDISCVEDFFTYIMAKKSFSEKCLQERCNDHPFECTDTRFHMTILRSWDGRKDALSDGRPIGSFWDNCEKVQPTFKKSCYDADTDTFYYNRSVIGVPETPCLNNGIKLKNDKFDQGCHCLGTQNYGTYCENHCDNLGFIIPEKCLNIENNDCPLPRSCVDLSRKNIYINRCKNNGMLLIKKSGNTCHCHGTGFYGANCEIPCLPRSKNMYNYPIECIF